MAQTLLNVMFSLSWYKPMPLQSLGTKLVMIIDSNLGQYVTASAESCEWRTTLVRISSTLMTAFGPGCSTSRIYLKQSISNEGNLPAMRQKKILESAIILLVINVDTFSTPHRTLMSVTYVLIQYS
jgi:hypothetical protein